jgi:hypothetical protein
MHSCDIKYLYEGTKELEKFYENKNFDYLYLTCSNCNNNEEYFKENFIYCTNCQKYFCNSCNFDDLVYDIYNKKICNCDNYEHITCELGHSFCITCKLPNCYECEQEDLEQNNCCFCYETFIYDDINYCEYHYKCLNIQKCIKCDMLCRPTYNQNFCNTCYFKYEY